MDHLTVFIKDLSGIIRNQGKGGGGGVGGWGVKYGLEEGGGEGVDRGRGYLMG